MDPHEDLARRSAELVALVREGDTEAFRDLFALVESSAFALALAHVGNPEDARDVVQDAALESYRKIDSLRDATLFPAWVCGMVRFLSFRRLRRPRSISLESLPVEPAVQEPSGEREGEWDASALKRALFGIPSHYREVLVLRHMEDKGYEEIAGLLGLSLAGVDSRLSRARALLRRKMAHLSKERA
jgi:RNA polymerase sigma-70 factor (ECF subfamily)